MPRVGKSSRCRRPEAAPRLPRRRRRAENGGVKDSSPLFFLLFDNDEALRPSESYTSNALICSGQPSGRDISCLRTAGAQIGAGKLASFSKRAMTCQCRWGTTLPNHAAEGRRVGFVVHGDDAQVGGLQQDVFVLRLADGASHRFFRGCLEPAYSKPKDRPNHLNSFASGKSGMSAAFSDGL